MKNILRLIRFDYISLGLENKTFLLLCGAAVLLMLVFPKIAIMLPGLAVLLFSYGNPMVANKNNACERLYGVLPVSRSDVIRALFLELNAAALIGELIAFIIYPIASAVDISAKLQSMIWESYKTSPTKVDWSYVGIVGVFVFATLAVCLVVFLYERYSEEVTTIIVTMAAFGIIIGVIALLCFLDHLNPDQIYNSLSVGVKILICVFANAASLGICAVFYRLTLKHFIRKEL